MTSTEQKNRDYYVLMFDKIWDNPIGRKPNYLAIFLFILSHANKKDKELIINNQKIIIKRGQWLGSVRKISEHFNLSTGTVHYILSYLKLEHIVEHKTTKHFTLFTVINYDMYQPQLEHKVEHKVEHIFDNNLNTNKKKVETKDEDIYNNNRYIKYLGKTPENLKSEMKELSSKIGTGITKDWQELAFRYANYLNIKLSDPDLKARWLKFFKENYGKRVIHTALSYLSDYPPFKALKEDESKVKYFFSYCYKNNA